MNTFNLCSEPWVQVRTRSGATRDVSLRVAFEEASDLVGLGGELPTQSAAVLRLMLAILLRSVRADRTSGEWITLWQSWWRDGLPMDDINRYLDTWSARFDLRDPEAPFMQVATLTTASGRRSGLGKIIAELPDGHKFFTQRAGVGGQQLTAAEAARWLVHCQAFDPSGIKTGAVGDPRVKGGRGYPIGVGWTGKLGLVVLEGDDLAHTLLLNLDLSTASPASDRPVWERDPLGPAVESGHEIPQGPADVYTWQSRRILLIWSGDVVTDVQISNGDPLGQQNRSDVEPMTGWRRSLAQEKKLGGTIYMPAEHDPSRQIWRGLIGLLDPKELGNGDPRQRYRPSTLSWLETLRQSGVVDRDQRVCIRTVGIEYGTNNSVIAAVVDDSLQGVAATFTDRRLIATAKAAAGEAEAAVQALGSLARNIARATNSEEDGPSTSAREAGYAALDPAYRSWLRRLSPDSEIASAQEEWRDTARRLILAEGALIVETAGPGALRGREVTRMNGSALHLDAARAWGFFRAELDKLLPDDRRSEPVDPQSVSSTEPEYEGVKA